MKSWFCVAGLVVGAFFLQVAPAVASDAKVIVKAQDKSDLETVEMAVHQEMQPGRRYQFVTSQDRAKIDASFAVMQSLFDRAGSVDKMNEQEKVQLFNQQEAINAVLKHNDGDRLVCESVAPMGSHIPKTTCRTYRDIEQGHRDTLNLEQRMQQVPNPIGKG